MKLINIIKYHILHRLIKIVVYRDFLQDQFVTDREISTKKAGDIIKIEYLDKAGNKQVTELILEKVSEQT